MLLYSCATAPVNDPLKNTKELIKKGHVSLYKNGAFGVPNTSIRLIPPGPDALELVGEMMGMRARQSFVVSIEDAADSIYIVTNGTEFTYKLSKKLGKGSRKTADAIRQLANENSILLVHKSSEFGQSIVGQSWEFSKELYNRKKEIGDKIITDSKTLGKNISKKGTNHGRRFIKESLSYTKDVSKKSAERTSSLLSFAKNKFITGYAAIPSKMSERTARAGEKLKEANILRIIKEENQERKRFSNKAVDIIVKTAKKYKEDVSSTFNKAGEELKRGYQTLGISLAVLKSIRWVLQSILWNATVKPLANISAASVGYVFVNCVAFPVMVLVEEGVSTTMLAAEITWNTSETVYDLVAPSAVAATAGVFSMLDFIGSNLYAGVGAVSLSAVGAGEVALSKTAGVVVKGAGYSAGKGIQYIGIPLVASGVAVGGGTIGTVVGGVGALSGDVISVLGETAAVATDVSGGVLAGTTMVGGTTASVIAAAAHGVYELSKAVTVPAGYELGGGIVLGYSTLSHIGSHAILAVADCSYMVLSLEGPRWVIYAVKGNLGKGDDLPVGTVLDLEKMKQAGEEILCLPVSDEEMKGVVESVYGDLPEYNED